MWKCCVHTIYSIPVGKYNQQGHQQPVVLAPTLTPFHSLLHLKVNECKSKGAFRMKPPESKKVSWFEMVTLRSWGVFIDSIFTIYIHIYIYIKWGPLMGRLWRWQYKAQWMGRLSQSFENVTKSLKVRHPWHKKKYYLKLFFFSSLKSRRRKRARSPPIKFPQEVNLSVIFPFHIASVPRKSDSTLKTTGSPLKDNKYPVRCGWGWGICPSSRCYFFL